MRFTSSMLFCRSGPSTSIWYNVSPRRGKVARLVLLLDHYFQLVKISSTLTEGILVAVTDANYLVWHLGSGISNGVMNVLPAATYSDTARK